MSELNKDFWSTRYQENSTGWDIGYVSTPIKDYIDQLKSKDIRILVPGAGNSYEGEYLWNQGFEQTHVLDITHEPLENFKKRVPAFPEEQLILNDFFEVDDQFDLIIEQTFFCALDPELRAQYAKKMHELLVPGGKLVGLLFDFPLTEQGPPFGGAAEEYLTYFEPYFEIEIMERSKNSIGPRAGNELFIKLKKIG